MLGPSDKQLAIEAAAAADNGSKSKRARGDAKVLHSRSRSKRQCRQELHGGVGETSSTLNSSVSEPRRGVPELSDTGDGGKVHDDRFQRLRDRIRQKELKRSAVSHEATSESIKVPRTSHEWHPD